MKYFKILFSLMLCLALIGCSGNYVPGKISKGDSICIDGVEYIFFKGSVIYEGFGYMSVKFNRDSTVELCE